MSDPEVTVHPTATVDSNVELDTGVSVGPGCVIASGVKIGKNTKLISQCYIEGNTEIGPDCLLSSHVTIGTPPQDVGYRGEPTRVIIGSRNRFREFFTCNRATVKENGETIIGSDNYFMAYTHVAHDCVVGNHTVMVNNASLGGHVEIQDYSFLSALSAVHQFCRVGRYALVGGGSIVVQDILPFCRFAGARPLLFYGINAIGLRRQGFSKDQIRVIKEVVNILFDPANNSSQALKKISKEVPATAEREDILDFVRNSKRGICKKQEESWKPTE
jgi:UDP-N-acetylglucosamine acyltransferase